MTADPPKAIPGRCPDDGTCHHDCDDNACFRVRSCGPLSGVFVNDEWPAEVRAAHAETPPEEAPEEEAPPESPWRAVFADPPRRPGVRRTVIVPTLIAPGGVIRGEWSSRDKAYEVLARREVLAGQSGVNRDPDGEPARGLVPILGDCEVILDVVGGMYRRADQLREEAARIEHEAARWINGFPWRWEKGQPEPCNEVQFR